MFFTQREFLKPTVVTDCITAKLFSDKEPLFVVAKINILHVYSVKDSDVCLEQEFVLANKITGLEVWAGKDKDRLVVAFEEAKVGVMEYNEEISDLVTLSLHFYEKEEYKSEYPYLGFSTKRLCKGNNVFLYFIYQTHVSVLCPQENGELKSNVHSIDSITDRIAMIYDVVHLPGYSTTVFAVLFESEVPIDANITEKTTKNVALLKVNRRTGDVTFGGVIEGLSSLTMFMYAHQKMNGIISFTPGTIEYTEGGYVQFSIVVNSMGIAVSNKKKDKKNLEIDLNGSWIHPVSQEKHFLITGNGNVYMCVFCFHGYSLVDISFERRFNGSSPSCLSLQENTMFVGSSLGSSYMFKIDTKSPFHVFETWGLISDVTVGSCVEKKKARKERRLEIVFTTKKGDKEENVYSIRKKIRGEETWSEMKGDRIWHVDGSIIISNEKETFFMFQKELSHLKDIRKDEKTILFLETERFIVQVLLTELLFFTKEKEGVLHHKMKKEQEIEFCHISSTFILVHLKDKGTVLLQIEDEEGKVLSIKKEIPSVDACCLFEEDKDGKILIYTVIVSGASISIFETLKDECVFEDCLFGYSPPILFNRRDFFETNVSFEKTSAIMLLPQNKRLYLIERKNTGRTSIYIRANTSFKLFKKTKAQELSILCTVRDIARKTIKKIENLFGYSGVFIHGETSFFILFEKNKKEPTIIPFAPESEPRDIVFVKQSCLNYFYLNKKGIVIKGVLEPFAIENGVLVRKCRAEGTAQFIAYDPVLSTICVSSYSEKQTSTTIDTTFHLTLFDMHSFFLIDTFLFETNEHVTVLKSVLLRSNETKSGVRPFIICCTVFMEPEAISLKGTIYVFDPVEIVPDPNNPKKRFKLKLVSKVSIKGAVTALCGVQGYLATAQTTKTIIYKMEEEGLTPTGFSDTAVCGASMAGIKNYFVYGDEVRGLFWFAFQEDPPRVKMLGKTEGCFKAATTGFVVQEDSLVLVSFGERQARTYLYAPESILSAEGEILIPQTAFRTSSVVSGMFRITVKERRKDKQRHETQALFYTTQDGSICVFCPLEEQRFRRFNSLCLKMQSLFSGYCGMTHGKALLSVEQGPFFEHDQGNSVIVFDDVFRFLELSDVHQEQLCRKVGIETEDLRGDILDVLFSLEIF
eukprot:GHVN01086785.1.p1 GENE.GHVN01086785.1~~GHVN01086785.1.p1  ORF type:complete len:1146 (+),score=128.11 GHVN01086785.1:2-3439(+)